MVLGSFGNPIRITLTPLLSEIRAERGRGFTRPLLFVGGCSWWHHLLTSKYAPKSIMLHRAHHAMENRSTPIAIASG